MTFTAAQLMQCAERELRLRQRVYPRFVKDGSYTADRAMREIAMMEAIMLHFAEAAEMEPKTPDLFEPTP
jgi:hypothetical protein